MGGKAVIGDNDGEFGHRPMGEMIGPLMAELKRLREAGDPIRTKIVERLIRRIESCDEFERLKRLQF